MLFVNLWEQICQATALVRDRTPPGPGDWVRGPGVPDQGVRELAPGDVINCRRRVLAVVGGTLNVAVAPYPFPPYLCLVVCVSREYLAEPVPDEARRAEIMRACDAAGELMSRGGFPWMPVQAFPRRPRASRWGRFAERAGSPWRAAVGRLARTGSWLRACAGRVAG